MHLKHFEIETNAFSRKSNTNTGHRIQTNILLLKKLWQQTLITTHIVVHLYYLHFLVNEACQYCLIRIYTVLVYDKSSRSWEILNLGCYCAFTKSIHFSDEWLLMIFEIIFKSSTGQPCTKYPNRTK